MRYLNNNQKYISACWSISNKIHIFFIFWLLEIVDKLHQLFLLASWWTLLQSPHSEQMLSPNPFFLCWSIFLPNGILIFIYFNCAYSKITLLICDLFWQLVKQEHRNEPALNCRLSLVIRFTISALKTLKKCWHQCMTSQDGLFFNWKLKILTSDQLLIESD